jgi:phosphopantothenoylcysteine decarboxylase/phosphopantothenate--cysteine ligase
MSDLNRPQSSNSLSGRRILLGVTGGIAAYKACQLVRLLTGAGAEVQVIMTKAATRFVGPDTFAALSGRPVYTDLFEEPGRVLHVALAHDADIAVVAPATANTLAKLALGFADDLLSSTMLEVPVPVVVAPAMHSGMFETAATQENLRMLAERGVRIVGPVTGSLAAGDEGPGRMSEPEVIFEEIVAAAGRGLDLEGRRIVVTAGPTWEPIDPVRFVGNRSTGKMGFAIASEASFRGAEVTLIVGPGTVSPPSGLDRLISVTTAEEMRAAVLDGYESAEVVVMAAAVADYRPDSDAKGKLKKKDGPPTVVLVENPDILAELGRQKGGRVLVGFAAETGPLEEPARSKLTSKNLDFVVANEVGRQGTGFGAETNSAAIYSATGDDEPLRSWTKRDLAREICDRVAKLLA